MSTRPRPPRGMSLIEVMIALGILTLGLLAMWNLHVVGLTSTAAGRRQTIASRIAAELASGLEALPYDSPLISETGTAGPNPPTPFGPLVDGGGTLASGAHVWSDGAPVPNVRLTTEMPELAEASASFERRWTVWAVYQGTSTSGSSAATAALVDAAGGGGTVSFASSSTVPAAKVIAVSVTWNDPPFARPREVVQYAFVANPACAALAISGSGP